MRPGRWRMDDTRSLHDKLDHAVGLLTDVRIDVARIAERQAAMERRLDVLEQAPEDASNRQLKIMLSVASFGGAAILWTVDHIFKLVFGK